MTTPLAPTSPLIGTAGGVSNDASRLASAGNLEKAGQRFESIFTGMMLKSMRSAKLADGLFDNKAGEQFRDMADAKVAESMAAHTPLGIGRAMTDFLRKSQATEGSVA
ncbi:flagellar protein FlgJ [Sphingomonas guangdongensis]|uniref:Flagellar protein FlgJ n=1 Tax=Sphingomonas guangdongensis TaxID=1141890 RepID=A0A285QE51_9SPHN|nr:rod-binding protein [Sphingomonas guangdongensis]SOB80210.1 flagellar protein FlgJ [Sphingomonas guangdongensis]